jgi:hypothetical protein
MKDFSHAAFSPELISIMQQALEQAVSTLPHPLRSMQVQSIAENIFRGTKEGAVMNERVISAGHFGRNDGHLIFNQNVVFTRT